MRITFADCVLDTDARQVRRAGVAVRLSPKAYELLCVLVECRPRVLSKHELYARLWKDTFVVEANLANLVSEIRTALGDSARESRLIRTAHGFGYAFCAEVHERPKPAPLARHYLVWNQREFALPSGRHDIGRDPRASVRFDLPSVSRFHARVTVADEGATIEDLGSKNGTLVRGQRLGAPTALHDGDEIRLGAVVIIFREWVEGRPTVTLADA